MLGQVGARASSLAAYLWHLEDSSKGLELQVDTNCKHEEAQTRGVEARSEPGKAGRLHPARNCHGRSWRQSMGSRTFGSEHCSVLTVPRVHWQAPHMARSRCYWTAASINWSRCPATGKSTSCLQHQCRCYGLKCSLKDLLLVGIVLIC